MDITNIPANLIKALEQKSTEQLIALSRVLNLVQGKIVIVSVSSTAPVTQNERQELLKQTATALAQINKQGVNPASLTPAVKTEISRLVQQQDLIKSPELKWANIVVNNRSLTTYTDRPLSSGQHIAVQLQTPQKLVFLDLSDAEMHSLITEAATLKPTANPVASSGLLATLSNKESPTQTPLTPEKPIQSTSTNPTPNSIPDMDPAALLKTTSASALDTIVKARIASLQNELVTGPISSTVSGETVLTETTKGLTHQTSLTSALQQDTLADDASLNDKTTSLKNTISTNSDIYVRTKETITKDTLIKDVAAKAPAELLKNSASFNNYEITKTVGENLRALLPHKDIPNTFYAVLNQWQQLPSASRQQLVSPNVEQALKSLAEQIRSPMQLLQPRALAQVIKNSGVFFENKLNNTIQKNSTDLQSPLTRTYNQDQKGALLNLVNKVTRELTGSDKPLTTEQTVKLLQQVGTPKDTPLPSATGQAVSGQTTSGKLDPSLNIGLLMQQLLTKPVKELSDKELRTQLLILLQQHSVHSLAKIQLQQLHSINQDIEAKDKTQPNASWQLEIPVKHHNDVQQLHLRIDRDWVEDKNAAGDNKSTTRIKQWSVTLRFDLPKLGEFCAQLAIIDTSVSATLWATQEKTLTRVKKQMDELRKQLEDEGIHVKQLQCIKGMPPEKPMALSYSLIDVST